jgi:hypothetical protein
MHNAWGRLKEQNPGLETGFVDTASVLTSAGSSAAIEGDLCF